MANPKANYSANLITDMIILWISLYTAILIFGLIIAILNIILFFKVLRMTKDVKAMHKLTFLKEAIERKPNEELQKSLDNIIADELSLLHIETIKHTHHGLY